MINNESKKKRLLPKYLSPLLLLVYAILLLIIVIIMSNIIITTSSRKSLFDDISQVTPHKVGIVLGTSRYLQSGESNPWFHFRIKAAAELYHAGKIKYIILSGDNREINYNEPEQMRREIIKHNVPDSVLFLDYAGLRTLDSMVRSRKIFGQDRIIVISQKFHNERAVFLAKAYDIQAIGYNAQSPESEFQTKVIFREILARVKVFIDLITQKQPRFLGEEVIMGE
jgi:SanA protein